MLRKLFSRSGAASESPSTPEIIGLRLGGAFELDPLRLRLLEPELIVENVAKTQFIEAVGQIRLDTNSTVLRFYTDDEGYLEVLLEGGMQEQHIADVKLWYFYDTQGIAGQSEWDHALKHVISRSSVVLEDIEFRRVWGGVSDTSPPVAMTETTWTSQGGRSQTDQFVMLYERTAGTGSGSEITEYCRLIGEEKLAAGTLADGDRLDHCLVTSTGFDIRSTDIQIIG